MKKRTILAFITLVLCCLVLPTTVYARDDLPAFYDPFSDSIKYPDQACDIFDDCLEYGADGQTRWYYVNEDITIDHDISIRGNINFIINAAMRVNGAINVLPNAKLSLYNTQRTPKDGTGLIAYAICGSSSGNDRSLITINGGDIRCVNTPTESEHDMLGGKGAEVVINGGQVMILDNYCSSALDHSAIGGEKSSVIIELHNEEDWVKVIYSSSFKTGIGGKNSEVVIRCGDVSVSPFPGDTLDSCCNKVIGIGGVNSSVNIYDHLNYSFIYVPTIISSEGFDNGAADVSGSGEAIGGPGSKVNIFDGTISAYAGDCATAVGGNNSTVNISYCGGDSSFVGGQNPIYGGAAVGGNESTVTISGGIFNATTCSKSAAIGSSYIASENKSGSATVRITASPDKDLNITSVFYDGACPDAAIGSGKGGRSVVILDGVSGKAHFDFEELPASSVMFGGTDGQSTVNIYAAPDESSPAYTELPKVDFVFTSDTDHSNAKLIRLYVPTAKFTLPGDGDLLRNGKVFFAFHDNPGFTGSPIIDSYTGSDLTLYPRFITPYSPTTGNLIYFTNGGTINGEYPTKYVYGVGTELPTDVTKEGYTFNGWYTSALSDRIYSVSPDDRGSFLLYATWKQGAPKSNIIPSAEPLPASSEPQAEPLPGSGQAQGEQTPSSSETTHKEPSKTPDVSIRSTPLRTSISWKMVDEAVFYAVFSVTANGSYEYMDTIIANASSDRYMFLDLAKYKEAHSYLIMALSFDEEDTDCSDPIVLSAIEITIEVPQAAVGTFGNEAQMITSHVDLVNQASALASSKLNKRLIAAIASATGGGSTFASMNGGHSKYETG